MGASVVAETVLTTSAACEAESANEGLSFSNICDRHAPFVWRTLRRPGVRERDVVDACQEVFLVVHRKLGALGEQPSIEGWIFRICRRVAAAHRRRASERRERASLAAVVEP
jgi:RNA polymerase sigma-70 factor, ECF subfamily